jgi:peptide-methionine (S)-S-oxide reductase
VARPLVYVLALGLAGAAACTREDARSEVAVSADARSTAKADAKTRTATFGGGCFWCTEAVFRRLEGVVSVESGYAGGKGANPTYEQVCSGATGHAEVVQVRYDPSKVSYEQLLEVFWKTHDPTTVDAQGADVGTQYRSVIFAHDEEQRRVAEDLKARLEEAKAFDGPIVTQVVPYETFWKAEGYHQDYFAANPVQPYCRAVIAPKISKFEKAFADRLKGK